MLKRVLFYLIYWTWCFPQSFIGLIWFIICKIRRFKTSEYNRYSLWTHDKNYSPAGEVSLGMFIFCKDLDPRVYLRSVELSEVIRDHEWGHVLQSFILGPFYLIVIGLPSAIWNLIYRKINKNYYWFYTETWADSLAEIKRKK